MMKQLRLVIDPEVSGIYFDSKYPYFRLRGRPVTEEQAFDILRRTDLRFRFDLERQGIRFKDMICHNSFLLNDWFDYPCPLGWVRPSGQVGLNGISGEKYPCERTAVFSVLPLMLAFPYLDMIIGITEWFEAPPYAWDAYFNHGDRDVLDREDYPDFEENIVYGIWVHDGTLELMAPARAREKYAQYNTLYAGPDEDVYKASYYDEDQGHPLPVDLEHLKRCIRSHGLDPEEVLAPYEWNPITGLDRRPSATDANRSQ